MEVEPDGAESDLLPDEKDQERYRNTRNGDHLMKVPFECDQCHFRNINKRDLIYGCKKDEDMYIAIRRAQLDVFWAQEPSTVANNCSCLRRDYLDSTTMFSLGEDVLLICQTPWC